MSANQNPVSTANIARATIAWGDAMPHWVRLLATACDASSQRLVGDRLGKSSGYVSRLVNNVYTGDVAEAARLVRAAFGEEDVLCPIWGAIPLASCMRARRRKGEPRNHVHRVHRAHCPSCPINTDAGTAAEES